MTEDEKRALSASALLLAIDNGVLSYEQGAELLRTTPAMLKAFRDESLRAVSEQWSAFEERRKAGWKQKIPPKAGSLLGRTGWIDVPGVPISHVKIVAVSPKPCVGCGRLAGTIEYLEDTKDGAVKKGRTVPECCLDHIVLEGDPANTSWIADIKARNSNPARN